MLTLLRYDLIYVRKYIFLRIVEAQRFQLYTFTVAENVSSNIFYINLEVGFKTKFFDRHIRNKNV